MRLRRIVRIDRAAGRMQNMFKHRLHQESRLDLGLVGHFQNRLEVADRISGAGEELDVAIEIAGTVGNPRKGRRDADLVVRIKLPDAICRCWIM
jgi:hypothetical protein